MLGSSAIEDKLQQGVPEAIECLRLAEIKVWVSIWDKQETSISIGYSSKPLTNRITQIIINSKSKESCRKSLQDALIMSTAAAVSQVVLIIDATSLVYILDTELEEEQFKLASKFSVVLRCRVAPLQKAGIVSLVKNRTADMTLSIGDGDFLLLCNCFKPESYASRQRTHTLGSIRILQKMADVGVGISGNEGRQAILPSDFAMRQFEILSSIGPWALELPADGIHDSMILNNFYRNFMFVLVLFWYVLFTSFALTTAINEWSSMLYSIIYTSVSTIVVGIPDKDVSRRSLEKYYQLYGGGQRQESYNSCKLFCLCLLAIIVAALVPRFVVKFIHQYAMLSDI